MSHIILHGAQLTAAPQLIYANGMGQGMGMEMGTGALTYAPLISN